MSVTYGPGVWVKMHRNSRSVEGTGKLRSYLLPPGAVGALYGSGCFHFSSRFSVSSMINCGKWWVSIGPGAALFSSPLQMSLLHPSSHRAFFREMCVRAYPLLSGLCDVLVGLEETADVQGLAAPDVAVDGPVEGELQGAAVERAGLNIRGMSHARIGSVGAHRIWGLVAMVGEVVAVAACQWI